MTITDEMLAAYADGELDQVSAVRVEHALKSDPALAKQLEELRSLKATLVAHYDPILASPLPERLTGPIDEAAKVVDLDKVRAARQRWFDRPLLRYGAVAAGMAVVLFLNFDHSSDLRSGGVDTRLAQALDTQVSGAAGEPGTRILLSFRDRSGTFCRGYADSAGSGIACHENGGWKVRMKGGKVDGGQGDYRQAGSADAEVMAAAQDMAAGDALDADQERQAIQAGWEL